MRKSLFSEALLPQFLTSRFETLIQRPCNLKRRKDAYEALHPETKNGATGGGHDQSRQVGDSASPDRFTADTASKTGQSERAVQLDAERGAKISERALQLLKGSNQYQQVRDKKYPGPIILSGACLDKRLPICDAA